jgi:hypothetical protein
MSIARSLLAFAAAACCLLAVSGCSALGLVASQTSQVLYSRWKDAPKTGGADVVPPAFVPHDAKVVSLRTLRDGNGSILRFTSKSTLNPRLCKPARLRGRPALDTNWWPITKPPARGVLCSPAWRVFVESGTTYAWSPKS